MKQKRLKYIVTMAILLATLPNISNRGQVPADSLGSYLRMAAENNPGVRADLLAYKAALQQLPQAGAYPDPTLDMGFYLDPMAIVGGKQVAEFKVMQMFPWFGTKRAARTEAAHRAQMAYEKFRVGRDALYLEVYTQWYKLCALRQQLSNSQENRSLLTELEQLATRRFSAAKTGMSVVLRVQMEEAEVENILESRRSQIAAETVKFNTLLNRPVNMPVAVPDSLQAVHYLFDEAATRARIESQNPTLGRLQQEELASDARQKLARKQGLPMLGIGLQYMLNKKIDDPMLGMGNMNGRDMVMPMVSVTLPLYRHKYKAQLRQSQLQSEASHAQYDNTRNALEAQLYATKQRLDDAARQVALYRKQAALARSTYEVMVQEFVAGTTTLTDVIGVQRQLLDYRLKEAEAIADYNTQVASIRSLASFGEIKN
ncbi:MAG: TolC family protein [Mediterranea sp.]|nr:TolC family protein [Mediterranea sp.]